MLHTPSQTFDDQIYATSGPARAGSARHGRLANATRSVTLERRTLTVLPAHDGIRITCDEYGEIDAIEIGADLALAADDQAELLRRGVGLGDADLCRLPLRIAVPKPLWRNIPCAREPLRIAISLEAVCANGAITLHARAHRLFPADGAGAWAA